MIGVLNFPTGTQVSVISGTHKGKLGTVSEEKPSRKSHQGKTPVRIGGAGRCKTCWIETDYLALQEKPQQLVENSEYDSEDTTSLPPEQIKILEYLSVQDKPVSSIAIATELDWSLFITEKRLKDLISNEYVEQVGDYDYQVTEKWTLQQSDCSRESAASSAQPKASEDSNGSNLSKLMEMPNGSCNRTIPIPFTTKSEPTTPNQAQLTSLSSKFCDMDLSVARCSDSHYEKQECQTPITQTLNQSLQSPTGASTRKDSVQQISQNSTELKELNGSTANQWLSKQSVYSPAWEDLKSQPQRSGDSTSQQWSKSTQTPNTSLEPTFPTSPSTTTSEPLTQSQEAQTSSWGDSAAQTLQTQATAQDWQENIQASGENNTESSTKSDPNLSSSKTQKVCDIEDLTKLSTPLPLAGTWENGSVYQQPTLERPISETDYLSLPTPNSSIGTENSRPAGTTKLEQWFKDNGMIQPSHALSAQMMALLSNFPADWTACLSQSPQEPKEESEVDISTAEQLYQPAQPLPSTESNTSTPYSTLRQWVSPQDITLTAGTQSRDLLYGAVADSETMDRYAEMMKDGLWEWAREPLPVAFIDADGKIYAGDCHNRVSAARAANRQILMELKPGTLQDAKLYSCKANTDHGLPLRPKDNRKRIEMFLDLLSEMESDRSLALLQQIPGLTETERSNGRWSARVIAKYLKLTESGYRTVTNIQSEREMTVKISQFQPGDYVKHKGTIAQVYNCEPKKGLLIATVNPENESQIVQSYVKPDEVEKCDPPTTTKPQPKAPKSVKEELKNKAKELGLPTKEQTLPDVPRNDGPPETLIDDRPFASTNTVESHIDDICIAIISNVDRLSDAQIKAVWEAIKPRVRSIKDAE